MTSGDNSMIAGCIERLGGEGCGNCARRDRCVPAILLRRTASGQRRGNLYRVLRGFAGVLRELRQLHEPSVQRRVEQRLEFLLEIGPVRIHRVARELGCSRQTLYRRLKSEGITFAELVDGFRRRRALELVADRGLSVKEIAYRLGFSDPASFSRAFKRWTGASPQALRGG